MSKVVKIYCEGKRGSHDYDLLDKIVSDLAVSIQPLGSKKGAGSAIQVYEQLAEKSHHYLLFRDRDFDAPVPTLPSLTQERYTYYSYRTTIENYLFDSQLFHAFLKEKGLETKYKLSNPAEVQQVFIKAAQKIAYYQAIRHTMGKIRIPTDFGTTWIQAGSGTLPTPDELDNPAYCRQRALEKMAEAKQQTDVWTEQTFDTVLNDFYNQFNKDAFYQNLDFLIWFQGKDFAKSLSGFLPEFPMKTYYKFAKTHFDYTQFADLMEIRKLLESYVSAL